LAVRLHKSINIEGSFGVDNLSLVGLSGEIPLTSQEPIGIKVVPRVFSSFREESLLFFLKRKEV